MTAGRCYHHECTDPPTLHMVFSADDHTGLRALATCNEHAPDAARSISMLHGVHPFTDVCAHPDAVVLRTTVGHNLCVLQRPDTADPARTIYYRPVPTIAWDWYWSRP